MARDCELRHGGRFVELVFGAHWSAVEMRGATVCVRGVWREIPWTNSGVWGEADYSWVENGDLVRWNACKCGSILLPDATAHYGLVVSTEMFREDGYSFCRVWVRRVDADEAEALAFAMRVEGGALEREIKT